MKRIDLNCDMGEGCPNDLELMSHVSSVNIACGAHAGDETTMFNTVRAAHAVGLKIGAHPSYPDRENFGRNSMDLGSDAVFRTVSEQIAAIARVCREAGARLSHVKPHGALYNRSAKDIDIAVAIAAAVAAHDPGLVLFGLAGSFSISAGKNAGLRTASEAFADRRYMPDGSLMPRGLAGAVFSDVETSAAQALSIAGNGLATAADGSPVAIAAETICIHGDGPNAVRFAAAVREALLNNNISICGVND